VRSLGDIRLLASSPYDTFSASMGTCIARFLVAITNEALALGGLFKRNGAPHCGHGSGTGLFPNHKITVRIFKQP